jgi:molybdopterin-guanine dinucleotide biosynthesis protein A
MNSNDITGIVLAGGRSKRMGEDKSLMKLNGKTMVEFSVDALKTLCSSVIISSNQEVYDFTGCQVWPDEVADQAPIVGIYSCLKRSESEINIILSCDMPLINCELLKYLLARSADYEITVPIHENGMIEPLCGIYKRSAIDVLKMSIDEGNFSLKDCIRKTSHLLVPVDNLAQFVDQNFFRNINTPADFEDISKLAF